MTTAAIFDAFRLVSLVAGSMSLAVAALVALIYARRYAYHRRAFQRGEVPAWRGLLPRHVALLGIAHILLVLLTMTAMARRINEEPNMWLTYVWSPVCLLAYLLSLLAMRDVIRHSKYQSVDRNPS